MGQLPAGSTVSSATLSPDTKFASRLVIMALIFAIIVFFVPFFGGIAIVSCLLICVGTVIFGIKKSFPWFTIRGALQNAPSFLASVWAVLAGVSNGATTSNGAWLWWLLAVAGAFFGLVCGFNLYNYLSGNEAEKFRKMIRDAI